jgi:phosphohistidine phosphatase
MEIYLVRHAIAVERGTPGYPNDDRPLTDDGREKMEKAAKGIATLVEDFDLILTSPLSRARETAEIVAHAVVGDADVHLTDALLPPAAPVEALALLGKYRDCERVLLTGHEPNMSRLATALLGGDASVIEFKKGALCRIDVAGRALKNPGTLIYLLPPRVLRTMGKKAKESMNEGSE